MILLTDRLDKIRVSERKEFVKFAANHPRGEIAMIPRDFIQKSDA